MNNYTTAEQAVIDEANAAFWTELCGTMAAQLLGVTDNSPPSLKKFDDWYLDFYPYLLQHVPVHEFTGKTVVEIGLGYGTLSQKIAEAGAIYTGVDVSPGPVAMVNHRLNQSGLPGGAIQRSFLDNNLPKDHFDRVVSIGCFHMTGNLQRCFDETWRILKPGGRAHLMVYNRYSHRFWMQARKEFIRNLVLETLGLLKTRNASEWERAASDRSVMGEAAPEGVYVSVGEVKRRMAKFASVVVTKENMDESDDPKWQREKVLDTWGRWMGIDLYICAKK